MVMFPLFAAGWGLSGWSGAADHDVAVAGASAYFDGLLGLFGAVTGLEFAAHAAVLRPDVQPGGRALPDPEFQFSEAGLEHDRAAYDLADPDTAVRGLGADGGQGAVDGDVAVRRVQ